MVDIKHNPGDIDPRGFFFERTRGFLEIDILDIPLSLIPYTKPCIFLSKKGGCRKAHKKKLEQWGKILFNIELKFGYSPIIIKL